MTDHVRILLIDDDEEDFLIVSDMLAESENARFSLDWVQSYDEGLEAISRERARRLSSGLFHGRP